MQEELTRQGVVVLALLLCSAFLSFFRRLGPRDVIFFIGAVATAIVGVIPAKVVFHSIANLAVLILLLQQVISRLVLPRGKWDSLIAAAFFGAFLDHERLQVSFRARFLQAAFLIVLGGVATWFGSPINLAVCQLADYNVPALDLAKTAAPLVLIALLYCAVIKTKKISFPNGDAIVPLDSVWTRRGKQEGEIVEMEKEVSDLLPLRKFPYSFWHSLRWRPFLLLISGLVFAAAITESGLGYYGMSKISPFAAGHPLLFKAALFLIIFGLAHFLPNLWVAAVVFPFAPAFPVLIIVAATCAFLTPRSNETCLLAFGLGRYRKLDFLKFGAPLSLICLLMEILWN